MVNIVADEMVGRAVSRMVDRAVGRMVSRVASSTVVCLDFECAPDDVLSVLLVVLQRHAQHIIKLVGHDEKLLHACVHACMGDCVRACVCVGTCMRALHAHKHVDVQLRGRAGGRICWRADAWVGEQAHGRGRTHAWRVCGRVCLDIRERLKEDCRGCRILARIHACVLVCMAHTRTHRHTYTHAHINVRMRACASFMHACMMHACMHAKPRLPARDLKLGGHA